MSERYRVEKAGVADARAIHDLVNAYAQRGDMLARTMGEVFENLRDFFVIREGDRFLGCVALHIVWSDLAEVKSLAVPEDAQATGLGSRHRRRLQRGGEKAGPGPPLCPHLPPGVLRAPRFRPGGCPDAAAQGLDGVLPLPQVPKLQRDRPRPRPGR